MKHCSAAAPQYEASPLCSDMKHSAFAPYDEKIKNESLLPENALILIKSPQILRCKRSVRPLPEKKNYLKHTVSKKTNSLQSIVTDNFYFNRNR